MKGKVLIVPVCLEELVAGFVCMLFCVEVCEEDVRLEVLTSHSNVSVNQLTTFNILQIFQLPFCFANH